MSGPIIPVAVREKSLDLLSQAALAPREQAMSAWREWREAYDIDTRPWHDVRMLGAVAARIAWLEPDASIRPRVVGIRKFLWVQSQICLRHAAGGLAALRRAGIPVLLMKGAARIAADPVSAQERLIRDVDVLVPLEQRQQAFDALQEDGWSLVPELWQINGYRWAPLAGHHAWSLAKDKSEIDLHHFSNHLNRLRGDDDGLWARSAPLEWRGVALRVPSPADALLLALIHGVRWSEDSSADWTVDASALLDAGGVDWNVFLAEAKARVLEVVLLSGLLYLRDVLHKQVPLAVLDNLKESATPERLAEMEQYAGSSIPLSEGQRAGALFMAIQRLRTSGEVYGNGEPRLLKELRVSLLPTHCNHVLKLPPFPAKPGRLVLRITIGAQEAGESPIFCTVKAPGLTLGEGICGLTGAIPHARQEKVLTVPEALLDLRGVRELLFLFHLEGYRREVPASISLLREE